MSHLRQRMSAHTTCKGKSPSCSGTAHQKVVCCLLVSVASQRPAIAERFCLQWCAAVEAAAAPFMFEHAPRFARELRAFVACGLSVAAHDQLQAEAAAASAAAPLGAPEPGALLVLGTLR